MKRLSLLFSILLFAWIIIVSYWYTCKVRNNCAEDARTEVQVATDPAELAAESPAVPEKDSVAMAVEFLEGVGIKKYYFEFASTVLNTAGDEDMYFSSLGFLVKNKPGTSLKIVGHACSRGSAEANERFSKMRAERVKKHLVEKGIPAEKINMEWKGDREPAASNDSEDGRKLNRRAEISINQ